MSPEPTLAVVTCGGCTRPWLVELRHRSSACPGCGKAADLSRRARLWQGDHMPTAQLAVARLRAAQESGMDENGLQRVLEGGNRTPRHDSPRAAAAAKARGIINKSQRAEAVALTLTRLQGPTAHEEHVEAMRAAGLDRARAEKEIVRMLAMDVLFEPQVGRYASLET